MKLPLVSILIPCFNAGGYVQKAIESILSQSYENLEIWLLDDASIDNTREILKGFNDKRINYHFVDQNTKKIGIVNDVLSMVNGEYIAFQDADDWSDPERIKKQVYLLESSSDIGIVFTNVSVRSESNSKPLYFENEWSSKELKNFFNNYGQSQFSSSIACATMLVKTDIIRKTGGYHPYFHGKAGSDIFWVYNILKFAEPTFINEPLYHIQRTTNSFTEQLHSIKNVKSAYIWKVISKLIEYDQKGVCLLDEENQLKLTQIELEACETSLIELNERKNMLIKSIRESKSYTLGNRIVNVLNPFR